MSCCPLTGPPGKKIYEHDGLAFFEVDGADDNVYAVNLCLLAKLFLDHKTVYYDTKPFYFYVLCERTEDEYNIVGYFSKVCTPWFLILVQSFSGKVLSR